MLRTQKLFTYFHQTWFMSPYTIIPIEKLPQIEFKWQIDYKPQLSEQSFQLYAVASFLY